MADTYTYFIFGSEAVRILQEEGLQQVIDAHEDNELDYTCHIHNPELDTPFSLLNAFNGHGDFASLTKEEYDRL